MLKNFLLFMSMYFPPSLASEKEENKIIKYTQGSRGEQTLQALCQVERYP